MLLPITGFEQRASSPPSSGAMSPFITGGGLWWGRSSAFDHDSSASWCPKCGAPMPPPRTQRPPGSLKMAYLGWPCTADLEYTRASPSRRAFSATVSNQAFVTHFMGDVYSGNPSILFDETMLKPELQGMEDFHRRHEETWSRPTAAWLVLIFRGAGSIDPRLTRPFARSCTTWRTRRVGKGHTIATPPCGTFSPGTTKVLASALVPANACESAQAAYDRSFLGSPRRLLLNSLRRMARLFRRARSYVAEQIRKSAGGDPAKVLRGHDRPATSWPEKTPIAFAFERSRIQRGAGPFVFAHEIHP